MASDLQELRDLYTHDSAEWKPIRDEGTTDMQFAAGDPWDPKDRESRRKANRPCISADEISQYINQVVNEVRANKRAVKFTPIGDGANDDTAKFYANKMREIEYRSRATIAYTTAFENCVCRSFGFVRVNTRYQHARAVTQDLWIDPVPNPNLITPDSQSQMPDLSDMGHCWVREAWTHEDFNSVPKWAKHKILRFTSDLGKMSGEWITDKRVFVGEFWKVKTKARTLCTYLVPGQPDPVGYFKDELTGPVPGTKISERQVDDPSVVQQITNGLEILEENQWPGKYIPIIGCLGKVLYLSESGSETRKILSMIRLARDPQMLYAFLLTAKVETVGMMTKFPYFAYEGQLSQRSLNDIAKSNHEPVSVILVKPTVEGVQPGTVLPHPQRNPWSLELSSYELAQESARRSIQASMGQTPLPTSAQRRNEKSGVALKQIEETGQRGSFHFTDHYLDMLTHTGIVCEDLIGKIYVNPQSTGIRKDDDTAEIIRINDTQDPKSISTKGDHLVTVSTGPSFDSEREAANDFASDFLNGELIRSMPPEMAMKLIAKAIKLKNLGPIGDQMIEIIAPEPPKEGEQPTEQQLQQALEQAKAQMSQMGQALQQAQTEIQTDQAKQKASIDKARIDQETELRRADIDADRELALQVMKNAATIAVAHIAANAKGVALDAHAEEEAQAMGHEVSLRAADTNHEREMAELGHEQTLEQGAMSHAQNLEAQAMQPPNGGGA